MAAARRLLWRAALFLWMIFLSAMRSTMLEDWLSTCFAPALSPPAIALFTSLIAERSVERRLALCRRCFSAWRERLRAESVLAMMKPK